MTTKTDPNRTIQSMSSTSKSKETMVKKTVRVNDMGDKLLTLITDLGWEYQRMSRVAGSLWRNTPTSWYDYRRRSLHGDLNDTIWILLS